MDQILEQARTIYEGEIDFQGQRLADLISTVLLTTSGVIAFLVGFITQNIYNTAYVGLGGTALTFLIVAPPWPFFNQNPLPWLPYRVPPKTSGSRSTVNLSGVQLVVDGKKVS